MKALGMLHGTPIRDLLLQGRGRPAQPAYRRGEVNRCLGCGRAQWDVRRSTAECVHCGTTLLIAAERHD